MLQDIAFAIWFLLPAAVANAIPVFSAHLPLLKRFNAPIDGGRQFHGHDLLGPHKTWRGIISGMVVATLILALQQQALRLPGVEHFLHAPIQYATLPIFLLGPAFAIGALGGDAIESFLKRQRHIASGGSWVPFDQLDYIIGSVLISLCFVILPPLVYVWIFIIWFLMHLIASYIGYKLGLKDEPI